jgi:Raf kinase inhibitor-like YbhB/YbcL family protein
LREPPVRGRALKERGSAVIGGSELSMRRRAAVFAVLFVCAGSPATAWTQSREVKDMTLRLTSTAFTQGGDIPARHTCEGQDTSPPLAWSGVPDQTKSLVLIVDDPDAPDPAAPQMTWVHWVLYNVPVAEGGLAEGIRNLPPGTLQGVNDWKRTGYRGPCPPIGRHRYFFKLYALDMVLSNLVHPSKSELEARIKGHVIAQTELIGTYQKRK